MELQSSPNIIILIQQEITNATRDKTGILDGGRLDLFPRLSGGSTDEGVSMLTRTQRIDAQIFKWVNAVRCHGIKK
jgi:hypothetical protein